MSAGITLRAGDLEACVLPEAGGGLAEFSWRRSGQRLPIFRSLAPGRFGSDTTRLDPNQLACYPLIPWSNRIGHGTFEFEGKTFHLARNYPREQYPIHGNGWLSDWRVLAQAGHAVSLELESQAGPFAYRGALDYALRDDRLIVRVSVHNRGEQSLPFGLGLHPWFIRTPGVQLRAAAQGMWLAGDDLLPVAHARVSADLVFEPARPLPQRFVDNAFTGWSGAAEIVWNDVGIRLEIATQPRLEYFHLYTPVGVEWFCFEPITHPANAFNLPAPHARAGLEVLQPGESTAIEVSFAVGPIPLAP